MPNMTSGTLLCSSASKKNRFQLLMPRAAARLARTKASTPIVRSQALRRVGPDQKPRASRKYARAIALGDVPANFSSPKRAFNLPRTIPHQNRDESWLRRRGTSSHLHLRRTARVIAHIVDGRSRIHLSRKHPQPPFDAAEPSPSSSAMPDGSSTGSSIRPPSKGAEIRPSAARKKSLLIASSIGMSNQFRASRKHSDSG